MDISNHTTLPSDVPTPTNGTELEGLEFEGFMAAGLAVIMFGTNYVPVKKVDPGDGELPR